MKVWQREDRLMAQLGERSIQVAAEILNTHENPMPPNKRVVLAQRNGTHWDFISNCKQAYMSCAITAHTTTLTAGQQGCDERNHEAERR